MSAVATTRSSSTARRATSPAICATSCSGPSSSRRRRAHYRAANAIACCWRACSRAAGESAGAGRADQRSGHRYARAARGVHRRLSRHAAAGESRSRVSRSRGHEPAGVRRRRCGARLRRWLQRLDRVIRGRSGGSDERAPPARRRHARATAARAAARAGPPVLPGAARTDRRSPNGCRRSKREKAQIESQLADGSLYRGAPAMLQAAARSVWLPSRASCRAGYTRWAELEESLMSSSRQLAELSAGVRYATILGR